MKTPHHILIAVATAVCTGLLLAQQDGEKKPAPPQQPPNENARPPFPPNGQPRPDGQFQQRPNGFRPEGERPPFPEGNGPDDRPFRPEGFRPQQGNRPPRPDDGNFPNRPNNGPQGPDPRQNFQPDQRPTLPAGQRPGVFPGNQGPKIPQPYLGVIARSIPPEFASHLKIPEGSGLVVDNLLDDSPAKTAGLARHDIIRLFNDQLLINEGQLEGLVRLAGKDKEIALTILRAGEEKKLTVKLGEKMMPERRPFGDRFGGGGQQFGPDDFQQPGQRPQLNRPNGDGASFNAPRYDADRARVVRKDDKGLFELSHFNGHAFFIARDEKGNVVWKGPVDTAEQRTAMPEPVRNKLNEIERSKPLDRVAPEPAKPAEQKP